MFVIYSQWTLRFAGQIANKLDLREQLKALGRVSPHLVRMAPNSERPAIFEKPSLLKNVCYLCYCSVFDSPYILQSENQCDVAQMESKWFTIA